MNALSIDNSKNVAIQGKIVKGIAINGQVVYKKEPQIGEGFEWKYIPSFPIRYTLAGVGLLWDSMWNKFVTTGKGTNDLIFESADGLTWTSKTKPKGVLVGDTVNLCKAGYHHFLSVERSGGNTQRLMYSPYGRDPWKLISTDNSIDYTEVSRVAFGNDLYLAVTSYGHVLKCVDNYTMTNWTLIKYPEYPLGTNMYDPKLVFLVDKFLLISYGQNKLLESINGNTWSISKVLNGTPLDMVMINNVVIIFLSDKIMFSNDGITWIESSPLPLEGTYGYYNCQIAYGNGLYVIPLQTATLVSKNLIQWRLIKSSMPYFQTHGIAFSQQYNRFVTTSEGHGYYADWTGE